MAARVRQPHGRSRPTGPSPRAGSATCSAPTPGARRSSSATAPPSRTARSTRWPTSSARSTARRRCSPAPSSRAPTKRASRGRLAGMRRCPAGRANAFTRFNNSAVYKDDVAVIHDHRARHRPDRLIAAGLRVAGRLRTPAALSWCGGASDQAFATSAITGISRAVFRAYSANCGTRSTWRLNRRSRSSPDVTVAVTSSVSLPTSIVACGLASRL